ncbi:MAG: DNA glycosylase [Fimbriimonadales bacterium]
MIPADQLDFGACVSSGQVFRFRFENGLWRGVDGENLIEAQEVDGGWDVRSSPDADAWKRFLQIDVDLQAVHEELVRREPRMAPIIARLPGLRTLRPAWPHEVLSSFLCTPNNHMSRITKMAGYLAGKGRELAAGHYTFPPMETIASLEEDELRANGFGYRGATIPKVAKAVLDYGDDWLGRLKQGTYEDARCALMGLPGIGPKLADCICLFGLHFDAAVPIDTHVWKVCGDWFLPTEQGKPVTRLLYESSRMQLADNFGRLAGWAQQYIFYDQFLSYRQTKSQQT